jgi:hypothetical protein
MNSKNKTRKVVTRSPQRRVGYINCSWFQDHPIEHESQLEKRFIHCALLCPTLIEIKSQPFKIETPGYRPYTPDFLLTFSDQSSILVEVKISPKVSLYIEKFKLVQQILEANNIKFFVLTEFEIDRFHQSIVAAEILRYAKSEIDQKLLDQALNVLLNANESELKIRDLAYQANCQIVDIFHLIARCHLTLHPDDLFNADARVYRLSQENESGLSLFENHFDVKPWVAPETYTNGKRNKKPGLKLRTGKAKLPYINLHHDSVNTPTVNPLSVIAGGFPRISKIRRPGSDR